MNPFQYRLIHLSRRALRAIAVLLAPLSLLASSCAAFRPTPVPLRTVEILRGNSNRCLVVLLPGRHDRPDSFRPFADRVKAAGLPIDLLAVDAHLGYYRKRSVIDRLAIDVVGPAKASGYDQIWIAGVSLGGLGGLLYLRDHPTDLAGVVALAPFLGADDVIREIQTAGGPGSWTPPGTIATDDVGRELWSWLRPGGGRSETVPLFLGWGLRDRFDRSNRMLADQLPPERVFTIEGGHDMKTWLRLWETLLDRGELCGRVKGEAESRETK